jgi:hypothetical protein
MLRSEFVLLRDERGVGAQRRVDLLSLTLARVCLHRIESGVARHVVLARHERAESIRERRQRVGAMFGRQHRVERIDHGFERVAFLHAVGEDRRQRCLVADRGPVVEHRRDDFDFGALCQPIEGKLA